MPEIGNQLASTTTHTMQWLTVVAGHTGSWRLPGLDWEAGLSGRLSRSQALLLLLSRFPKHQHQHEHGQHGLVALMKEEHGISHQYHEGNAL